MNILLRSCSSSNAGSFLLVLFIIGISVTILIIGAILKLYDISDSLKAHTAIMKEHQQELTKLNETEKARNEILKSLLHSNATNVTASCTSGTDNSKTDQS